MFKKSNRFHCCYCGARLVLELEVAVRDVQFVEPVVHSAQGADIAKQGKSTKPLTIILIEKCRALGIIQAYGEAFMEQVTLKNLEGRKVSLPNDLEKNFFTFLREAKRVQPTPYATEYLQRGLEGHRIQFWRLNDVVLVTLDDQIFRFFPGCVFDIKLAWPKQTLEQNLKKSMVGSQSELRSEAENWVRSKFGYVPAENRIFLKELSKQSIGAFGSQSS